MAYPEKILSIRRLLGIMKLVPTAKILNTLSDDKSLLLFQTIADCNSDSRCDTAMSNLHLTRNQYYSRLSKLVKADLVKRKNKKYVLTGLGRVVNDAQNLIARAINGYWKLKAIDCIEMSKSRISENEYNSLIDTLIDNTNIKDILLRHHHCKTKMQENRYASTIAPLQKRRKS
jgi:DNA-binding protein